MDATIGRKRSRLALDDDASHEGSHSSGETQTHTRLQARARARASASPALSVGSAVDSLKRSRTQSELDELRVVAPHEAWTVDVPAMVSHSSAASILVLCVQGTVQLHYDLLCSVLPQLYSLAPGLQALVLCRHPDTHIPSATLPCSLPLIQAVGPGYNHFVRLGLLHPLGGGQHPLDALVVVDAQAKRRLVLPFGWGAGKHAATPAGRPVQTHLINLLVSCVEMLARE